jgi:hypothetical protein
MTFRILITAVASLAVITACTSESNLVQPERETSKRSGVLYGSQKPDTTKPPKSNGSLPAEEMSLNFEEIKSMLDGLITDITPPPSEPVGLLLPAVQKVREAASRARAACSVRDDRDVTFAVLCAIVGFAKDDARFADIITTGGSDAGDHLRKATRICQKPENNGNYGNAANDIEALTSYALHTLKRLAREERGRDLQQVLEVLDRCQAAAAKIKTGWDVKVNK